MYLNDQGRKKYLSNVGRALVKMIRKKKGIPKLMEEKIVLKLTGVQINLLRICFWLKSFYV